MRFTALLTALVALSAAPALAQHVMYGEPAALGDGQVRTYLVHDHAGHVAELGIAISETAMATLPDLSDKPPMESFIAIDLPLPAGAPAPYTHAAFDWNSMGHPPVTIYGVPHFDFHFYLIDIEAKNAILPGDDDVPTEVGEFAEGPFAARAMMAPETGHLPATYAYAPGSAVPQMGGHWIDPASHEFHGQPFDKTFIYGTWDGQVIFIEPMITRAYLEAKPDETIAIAVPERYAAPGRYPTAYRAYYDAGAGEYRVALVGFEDRN